MEIQDYFCKLQNRGLNLSHDSDAAELLIAIFSTSTSESTRFGVLRCLRRMSRSTHLANMLAQEQHLSILFHALVNEHQKDTTVFSSVEILWNIFDHPENAALAGIYLGKQGPLMMLKDCIRSLSSSATRQLDKQRRNEFMVLCNRIADLNHPKSAHIFRDVGMLDLVYGLIVGEQDEESTLVIPAMVNNLINRRQTERKTLNSRGLCSLS